MKLKNKFYNIAVLTGAVAVCAFSSASPLKSKWDGEYITLSGKVSDVKADSFRLKADKKNILVEMDDNHWDADGYKLVSGDQVVVRGRVDKGMFEKDSVEAGSVYVKSLNSYFYANSADEEGDAYFLNSMVTYMPALADGAYVDLQGKVVSKNDRKFVVDTGVRKVEVDTADLIYNPLDNKGYTKIEKGDRVWVSGKVEDKFWGGKQVSAGFVSEI